MYPNFLLSVFIALVALQIIGGVVGKPTLAKAAGVLMVAAAAAALILWLLMGLSPVPPWFTKLVARLVYTVQGTARK
jgi:hypothetical protein